MKGVSPLIASVLLIAIVVSLAVIIGGWMQSLSKDTTTTISNKTADAISCSSSDIVIDAVYVTNGTSGSARIQVRNQGFQTVTLLSAQLINRTGYNFSSGTTLPSLSRGDIAQISFPNASVPVCPNDFSKIIVTTTCGGVGSIFTGNPNCPT